jgi:hypothetical protein
MQNDTKMHISATDLLADALLERLLPRLVEELRPTHQQGPAVLNVEQVAQLTGRTPHWVREHRLALGGTKPPGTKRLVFTREAVLRYMNGQ